MAVGNSSPLLHGTARHLCHGTESGGGYANLSVTPLQGGVRAQVGRRRSG